MQTTPIAGLPYPELTDLPNGPSAFEGLATALDNKIVPRFTNASARNLAITSPAAGQLVYLTTEGRYERYDGSGWRIIPNIQYGIRLTSFSSASSNSASVSFPVAFASTPSVFVNIASGGMETSMWLARAISVGTSSFTLFVVGPASQTWSNVPVHWVAVGV